MQRRASHPFSFFKGIGLTLTAGGFSECFQAVRGEQTKIVIPRHPPELVPMK